MVMLAARGAGRGSTHGGRSSCWNFPAVFFSHAYYYSTISMWLAMYFGLNSSHGLCLSNAQCTTGPYKNARSMWTENGRVITFWWVAHFFLTPMVTRSCPLRLGSQNALFQRPSAPWTNEERVTNLGNGKYYCMNNTWVDSCKRT